MHGQVRAHSCARGERHRRGSNVVPVRWDATDLDPIAADRVTGMLAHERKEHLLAGLHPHCLWFDAEAHRFCHDWLLSEPDVTAHARGSAASEQGGTNNAQQCPQWVT